MYASVRILKSTFAFDRPFDYLIPKKLEKCADVGAFVRVPFGRRMVEGIVVRIHTGKPSRKLKLLLSVAQRFPVTPEQIALAEWMAERYVTLFSAAIGLMLAPSGYSPRALSAVCTPHCAAQSPCHHAALRLAPDTSRPTRQNSPPSARSVRSTHGSIAALGEYPASAYFGFTRERRYEEYVRWINADPPGDGEVYLLLVPEVGDVAPLAERITKETGIPVDIYHSGLKIKDRRVVWEKQMASASRIIVGTRSALFLPLRGLKRIIVDEAESMAYASERHPRYFAPDVCLHIGEQRNIPVVLGGLIPRVEWVHQISRKEIHDLTDGGWRDGAFSSVAMDIVDLRHMRMPREQRLLSPSLLQNAEKAIAGGGKVALIVSRKGFFTLAMCDSCDEVAACPHCATPLAHIARVRKLRCAHCAYSISDNVVCENCKKGSLRFRGAGAERIESWLHKELPKARILRLDKDTAPTAKELRRLFDGFVRGDANVLIGTPLVLRYLSGASFAMVGLLSADFLLRFSDFRAPDNFIRVITQAASSVARNGGDGGLLLQTYLPEHPLYQMIKEKNLAKYWETEIENRRKYRYPPFGHLCVLTVQGADEEVVRQKANAVKAELSKTQGKVFQDIVGPSPAAKAKRRDRFRYQILLKGKDTCKMSGTLSHLIGKMSSARVSVSADIDPVRGG